MDSDSAVTFIESLTSEQQLHMLALLCHNITIVSRDTYGLDGNVKDAKRLRAINEVQHRTAATLVGLTGTVSGVGLPNNALVAMFFTDREDIALSRLLVYAFERSAATVQKAIGLEQ